MPVGICSSLIFRVSFQSSDSLHLMKYNAIYKNKSAGELRIAACSIMVSRVNELIEKATNALHWLHFFRFYQPVCRFRLSKHNVVTIYLLWNQSKQKLLCNQFDSVMVWVVVVLAEGITFLQQFSASQCTHLIRGYLATVCCR